MHFLVMKPETADQLGSRQIKADVKRLLLESRGTGRSSVYELRVKFSFDIEV